MTISPLLRRNTPVVPVEVARELQLYLEDLAKRVGVSSPKLVIEPNRDDPRRTAFYLRRRHEIFPNCRLLVDTWKNDEQTRSAWRAVLAHEFGHHVQYSHFQEAHDSFDGSTETIPTDLRTSREKDAWEIAERLTGISKREAHRILRQNRPGFFRFLFHGDFPGLYHYLIDRSQPSR